MAMVWKRILLCHVISDNDLAEEVNMFAHLENTFSITRN
jgi:hypothetical protein